MAPPEGAPTRAVIVGEGDRSDQHPDRRRDPAGDGPSPSRDPSAPWAINEAEAHPRRD
jgi:hypothetical protein